MSKQIGELERLAQLRANGLISEDEFLALKVDIVDAKSVPSMANGTPYAKCFGPILLGLAAVAILGGGVHWLAKQDGYADARREGLGSNASNMGKKVSEANVPPTDYLRLCVYSGLTPMGTRLLTMATLLAEQGRTVIWDAAGNDWIMRTKWRDQLTFTDHEEAFEFQRRDGASPAPACNRPIGEVQLNRVARDGIEIAEPDPSFASLLHQDIEPNGTTAEAVPSADALHSGRCKLVIKGQSYIDGPCFYSLDEEGSFSIYDTPEGTGGYFATLVRDGASGVGYWNGSKGSTHAQDELGTMSRNGACWSNGDHQICLWG